MKRALNCLTSAVSGLAIMACLPAPAWAQDRTAADPVTNDQATSSPDTGEIVVTAQKRSETLSNVGLTVTAVTGEQLAKQGIVSTADLVKVTPGFQFTEGTYGAPVYTLRGVGFYETSLAASPSVSVYIDEVPLPYPNQTRNASFDLDRVEVLKGPQGTLFGVNATGGAINYIAAKPTDTLHFGADGEFGRFNRLTLGGFVSGPISNTLTARIAVRTEQGDDWQESYTRKDSLGSVNRTVGRVILDWKPSDRVKFELMANGWYDKSDTQAGQLIGIAPQAPGAIGSVPGLASYPHAPASNRTADWNPNQAFRRDDSYYQASLRGDVELGDALTLTSISSYQHFKADDTNDTDGTTLSSTEARQQGHLNSFTQELRLQGGAKGAFNWIVGGNYEHDDAADGLTFINPQSTLAFSVPGLFISDSTVRNDQRVNVFALFANAELPVTDTFSVQGGIRYTDTHRTFAGCLYDSGDGNLSALGNVLTFLGTGSFGNVPPGGCVTIGSDFKSAVVHSKLNEDNVSWRAGAKWKVDANTLLYANISKGYKAGSFPTLGATVAAQFAPVVQESVLAYELGVKTNIFDRQLLLNAAAFYYDYRNKQTRGRQIDPILGALEALVNVPKSRVAGAEVDLTWHPVREVRLNVGGTYTDSKIRAGFANFTPLGQAGNFDGEALPLTPKWQTNASVDIERPLSGELNAFAGATLTYQSKSNTSLGNLALFELNAHTVLDLRVGLSSSGDRWRVSVWGKNVTNTRYRTNALHQIDTIVRYAAMPATYGVSFIVRY
jgi:outer membrane receptor protein involved in Fe transport